MSSTGCINWQGYQACMSPEGVIIQDAHILDEQRVHGPDSDYNCLVIAGINLLKDEFGELQEVIFPEELDRDTIKAATSTIHGESMWKVVLNQDASIAIIRGKQGLEGYSADCVEMNSEFHSAINSAWEKELSITNVSQGAYVSEQLYRSSESSRLSLDSQSLDGITTWPPRGGELVDSNSHLNAKGKIVSWTKLSSAGAPSEFSIRAPILDGITTVLLEFDEGPKGVFMLCDDESRKPEISDEVELVVRRLYAQEGMMRYGLKARYPN